MNSCRTDEASDRQSTWNKRLSPELRPDLQAVPTARGTETDEVRLPDSLTRLSAT